MEQDSHQGYFRPTPPGATARIQPLTGVDAGKDPRADTVDTQSFPRDPLNTMNALVLRSFTALATLLMAALLPASVWAAALINSTQILVNPTSTTNLWEYSVADSDSTTIPSYSAYATSTAHYASVVSQGFVSGDVGYTQDNFSNSVGDYKSIHTFGTWLISDFDQTIQLLFGGDDGHSLFVDGSFVGGAGFGINVIVDIDLLANQAIYLELVGYNNSGTWGFGIRDNVETQLVENIDGLRMDAVGAFVPTPATGLLLVAGVLGLRQRARRKRI